MDALAGDSQVEIEQHLRHLEDSVNRKMRSRLPGLALTAGQAAHLERFAHCYAAELAEALEKRGFRPTPSVIRYISLKAMRETVAWVQEVPTTSKTRAGRRNIAVSCIKRTIDEVIAAFNESFCALTGEELLAVVLTKRPEVAAYLVEESSFDQVQEMLEILIAARTGNKPAFYRMPKGAPCDYLDWLTRHAFIRYASDSRIRQIAEEPARKGVKVLLSSPRLPHKANRRNGKPVDYMAPIHAQVMEKLGHELNKHGHKVKDHGVGKFAYSLELDRSTVRRYLEEDLLIKLTPDGKGGVDVEFSVESTARARAAVLGKKRGPKQV